RTADTFGAPVRWLPRTPLLRRMLQRQDPTVELLDWDNPGVVGLRQQTRSRPEPNRSREVVIGVTSDVDAVQYRRSAEGVVGATTWSDRIRSTSRTSRRRQSSAWSHDTTAWPHRWRLLRHKRMGVDAFLQAIDFLV